MISFRFCKFASCMCLYYAFVLCSLATSKLFRVLLLQRQPQTQHWCREISWLKCRNSRLGVMQFCQGFKLQLVILLTELEAKPKTKVLKFKLVNSHNTLLVFCPWNTWWFPWKVKISYFCTYEKKFMDIVRCKTKLTFRTVITVLLQS